MNVGLESAGLAVPYHRLSTERIHDAWHNVPIDVVRKRGVVTRGVTPPDSDSVTFAVDAATAALERCGRETVDAIFVGTQTGPYVSRSSAALIADMLGMAPSVFALDVQFSGRSGTSALLVAAAWVEAGFGSSALAIGADTLGPHVAPGDPQEYVAGAGGAAVVVSREATLAILEGFGSSASDTPDAFRADGERYIRTTGAVMTASTVGLANHAAWAVDAMTQGVDTNAESFALLAAHQPDAATPRALARRLGFDAAQTKPVAFADKLGDCGSASALIGMMRALELTEEGQRILVVSYGQGAGSDAVALRTAGSTPNLGVQSALDRAIEIDYTDAIRFERRFHGHDRLVGAYE